MDLIRPIIHSGKMGPILIQLPPSFSNKQLPQLQEFLSILPTEARFAVEFRNKSWMNKETWKLLEQFEVAYTITDSPLLPKNPVITTDFVFIRWHGQNKQLWYDYQYSKNELKPWQSEMQKIIGNVKEVFGYFNNHPRGYAIRNLLDMNEILGRLTPKQVEIRQKIVAVLDGTDRQQKLF